MSRNSQGNTCARTPKLQSLIIYAHRTKRGTTSFKKTLRHRCFLVNFAKFYTTPFHRTHLEAAFDLCIALFFIIFFKRTNLLLIFGWLQTKTLSYSYTDLQNEKRTELDNGRYVRVIFVDITRRLTLLIIIYSLKNN